MKRCWIGEVASESLEAVDWRVLRADALACGVVAVEYVAREAWMEVERAVS